MGLCTVCRPRLFIGGKLCTDISQNSSLDATYRNADIAQGWWWWWWRWWWWWWYRSSPRPSSIWDFQAVSLKVNRVKAASPPSAFRCGMIWAGSSMMWYLQHYYIVSWEDLRIFANCETSISQFWLCEITSSASFVFARLSQTFDIFIKMFKKRGWCYSRPWKWWLPPPPPPAVLGQGQLKKYPTIDMSLHSRFLPNQQK